MYDEVITMNCDEIGQFRCIEILTWLQGWGDYSPLFHFPKSQSQVRISTHQNWPIHII